MAWENSEVSPVVSLVAVAVMNCPTGTFWAGAKVKEALPIASVSTCVSPRKLLPSPKPEGSAAGLLKNWMVKV